MKKFPALFQTGTVSRIKEKKSRKNKLKIFRHCFRKRPSEKTKAHQPENEKENINEGQTGKEEQIIQDIIKVLR
jgi:hypothetical protein